MEVDLNLDSSKVGLQRTEVVALCVEDRSTLLCVCDGRQNRVDLPASVALPSQAAEGCLRKVHSATQEPEM